MAQTSKSAAARNIVVVHGAFADGSGWEGVHAILTKDGRSKIRQPTDKGRAVLSGFDLFAHKQRNAHRCSFSSLSLGNMHSTRSSCAVMHCGVPTVVIKEK